MAREAGCSLDDLMKDGYRTAFSDPDVVASIIGNSSGVAVAYVEFSDADKVKLVLGWSVLTDEASARAFGEAIALAPRSSGQATGVVVDTQVGEAVAVR